MAESQPMAMVHQAVKSIWVRLYIAAAVLTLIFHIYVRADQCAGFGGCALSFAKAVVWAVIWPLSWVVYLAGVV